MVAEDDECSEVTWNDYYNLFKFSYGAWSFVWYLLIAFTCGFIQLFTSYYLAYWTELPFNE